MTLKDLIEEEKMAYFNHPASKRLNDIELTAIVTGRMPQYTGETLDVAFTQAMTKVAWAVVEEIADEMKKHTIHMHDRSVPKQIILGAVEKVRTQLTPEAPAALSDIEGKTDGI